MKSKIFFAIFIAGIGFLFWQGYPVIKNRYFSEKKSTDLPAPEQIDLGTQEDSDENSIEEIIEDTNEALEQKQDNLKQDGKIFQKITTQNCDSECAGFSGTDLEYCQEICGLKPIQTNYGTCDSLSGLKKDYCLKDLGIFKKDIGICDTISDGNIKTACKNRILEDNVDEIMGENDSLPS